MWGHHEEAMYYMMVGHTFGLGAIYVDGGVSEVSGTIDHKEYEWVSSHVTKFYVGL